MSRTAEVRLIENLIEPLTEIQTQLIYKNETTMSKAVTLMLEAMKDYLESQGY